jgi:hypothetical protein
VVTRSLERAWSRGAWRERGHAELAEGVVTRSLHWGGVVTPLEFPPGTGSIPCGVVLRRWLITTATTLGERHIAEHLLNVEAAPHPRRFAAACTCYSLAHLFADSFFCGCLAKLVLAARHVERLRAPDIWSRNHLHYREAEESADGVAQCTK